MKLSAKLPLVSSLLLAATLVATVAGADGPSEELSGQTRPLSVEGPERGSAGARRSGGANQDSISNQLGGARPRARRHSLAVARGSLTSDKADIKMINGPGCDPVLARPPQPGHNGAAYSRADEVIDNTSDDNINQRESSPVPLVVALVGRHKGDKDKSIASSVEANGCCGGGGIASSNRDRSNALRIDDAHEKQVLSLHKHEGHETRRKRFADSSDSSQINGEQAAKDEAAQEQTATTTTTITTDSGIKSLKCRVEKDLYLGFEEYRHYSCANCYNLFPPFQFVNKLVFLKETRIWLLDGLTNGTLLPNETETIKRTFKNEVSFVKWRQCCQQAIECCKQNSIYLPKSRNLTTGELVDEEPRDKCPATWDGLSCWPDSPAGLVAQGYCPKHAFFLDFEPICPGLASKQCFANGSWYIRHNHEWTDYNNCAVLPLYATRLLIGSAWNLVSAIVIGPALIVLDKMPNRGGSKRVKILSNLLFWLLVNGLLSISHKIGVIGGVFQSATNRDDMPATSGPTFNNNNNNTFMINNSSLSSSEQLSNNSSQAMSTTATKPEALVRHARHLAIPDHLQRLNTWTETLEQAQLHYRENFDPNPNDCDDDDDSENDLENEQITGKASQDRENTLANISPITRGREGESGDHLPRKKVENCSDLQTLADANGQALSQVSTSSPCGDGKGQATAEEQISGAAMRSQSLVKQENNNEAIRNNHQFVSDGLPSSNSDKWHKRCKRSISNQAHSRKKQPPLIVLICWIVSVGIRITRQLHYAWMFTGAIYLCSILHFAPAEPPTVFIKWLMFLTNGFPVVIGLVYVIARTIYEPSPLTLLVGLPYYYMKGDMERVEHLWATQFVCWIEESRYDNIEEIADFPNLVLIILNAALFIVTLIIMCRITRPGSTRPEMSLGDYFKAAGTLVLLYGAHYALIAYRPPVEGCVINQVMYYLFLFVDGIQGIAVSYVFCYRTAEGREIIAKWWTSWLDAGYSWCGLPCGRKNETRGHSLLSSSNRSNQSTRSNNSTCNGKDMATELINIHDIQQASQF